MEETFLDQQIKYHIRINDNIQEIMTGHQDSLRIHHPVPIVFPIQQVV